MWWLEVQWVAWGAGGGHLWAAAVGCRGTDSETLGTYVHGNRCLFFMMNVTVMKTKYPRM